MFGASVPSSFREERNTIFVPSGENSGVNAPPFPLALVPTAVALVSAVRSVPSPFTRQTLLMPLAFGASVPSGLREERKATRFELNRAVTALTASIISMHTFIPEQFPDHPV